MRTYVAVLVSGQQTELSVVSIVKLVPFAIYTEVVIVLKAFGDLLMF